MSDSIRVDAGIKTILINDDPDREVSFNPLDILFAEKFYALLDEFHVKDVEYKKKIKELEEIEGEDEYGLPENMPETFKLFNEMLNYLFEKIDGLFGKGTSKIVFGEHRNFEMIQQFFEGLMPFIKKARSERIKQYTKPAEKK